MENLKEMPLVITLSDKEVLFTRGNIVSIFWNDEYKQIVAVTNNDQWHIFKDDRATKFLNHFPYSYFESAEKLAELYKTNWSDNTF